MNDSPLFMSMEGQDIYIYICTVYMHAHTHACIREHAHVRACVHIYLDLLLIAHTHARMHAHTSSSCIVLRPDCKTAGPIISQPATFKVG